MTTRTDILRGLMPGALGIVLIAAAAAAQSPANDGRWEPWLGCWQPMAQENAPFQSTSRICVTQIVGGSAVEIATVADGRIVARDTIDASGVRRAIGAGGCTGWQRGDWSADARRVYLHSEVTCGTSLTRTSSGVIAMSPHSIWLDIQNASANGNSTVRDVRYAVAGTWTSDIPVEFLDMLRTRELTPYAMVARQLAGTPIGTKDIVEAVKQVDADVVQAWLIERGQALDVDAHTLLALADAGVPGAVTDVLIGLAFPEQFTLREAAPMTASAGAAGGPPRASALRYAYSECDSAFDPMWYSTYGFDTCAARYGNYGYGVRSPYGFGTYGYGYGYGYDVPFYGITGPGTVGSRKPEPPHGVAVNGKGYTRPTPQAGAQTDVSDQGSSRVGRNPSSGSGSGSSSSGSSSSGKSSSGSPSSGSASSGSSSGSGRTAQSRPPDPPKPVKPPPAP